MVRKFGGRELKSSRRIRGCGCQVAGLNWDLRKSVGAGDSIGHGGMRGQSQSCL